MTCFLGLEDEWVIESFRAELAALPETVEPYVGRREQVTPGFWVIRTSRWQPVSVLDRLAELPAPRPIFTERAMPGFDWHERARCAGTGLESYFGKDDAKNQPSLSLRDLRRAQTVCRDCPALRDCFVHSLTHAGKGESHGIWGGMSGRQRKPILKALEKLPPLERHRFVRRVTEEWLATL